MEGQKNRHKGSQEKAQGQPIKGTRAANKRQKGRDEKGQGPPRKGSRAAKGRHKGRQEKSQGQGRKGTSIDIVIILLLLYHPQAV